MINVPTASGSCFYPRFSSTSNHTVPLIRPYTAAIVPHTTNQNFTNHSTAKTTNNVHWVIVSAWQWVSESEWSSVSRRRSVSERWAVWRRQVSKVTVTAVGLTCGEGGRGRQRPDCASVCISGRDSDGEWLTGWWRGKVSNSVVGRTDDTDSDSVTVTVTLNCGRANRESEE